MNNCPHCNTNLTEPMDQEHIDSGFYAAPYVWKREIGIEYPKLYDGVWEFKCPDCGGTWDSEVKKRKEAKHATK